MKGSKELGNGQNLNGKVHRKDENPAKNEDTDKDENFLKGKKDEKRLIEKYIDYDNGMSCAYSEFGSYKRYERTRENESNEINKKIERKALEKMENDDNQDSTLILKTIPNSDKVDYCFQWVMNYGKIPRPPLHEAKNGCLMDGRKKRLVKRKAEKESNGRESNININDWYNKRKAEKVRFIAEPSIPDSGYSMPQSERNVTSPIQRESTLISLESFRAKFSAEPIDKKILKDIEEYFKGSVRDKIRQRDQLIEEKKQEEEEIRKLNFATLENEWIKTAERYEYLGDIGKDAEKMHQTSNASRTDTEVEQMKRAASQQDQEVTTIKIIRKGLDSNPLSQSENETDLPLESDFTEDTERSSLPETEIESLPKSDVGLNPDEKEEAMPSKGLDSSRSTLLQWKNHKPAVKLAGATSAKYIAKMMMMRRNRFHNLSLARPRPKPKQLFNLTGKKNCDINNNLRVKSKRRKEDNNISSRLILPPIVIPYATRVTSRQDQVGDAV